MSPPLWSFTIIRNTRSRARNGKKQAKIEGDELNSKDITMVSSFQMKSREETKKPIQHDKLYELFKKYI
jgi:hypothetical protein